MKKFILLSLSMLMAAGSMPIFGMDGGSALTPEQKKFAWKEGAKNGFYSGLFSGFGYGGYCLAYNGAKKTSHRSLEEYRRADEKIIGGMWSQLSYLLSMPIWLDSKSAFSQKLKDKNLASDKNRVKSLKQQYHFAEFAANTATTAGLATTIYAASNPDEGFVTSFGKAILPITFGVTALKVLTYGLWRNSSLASKKAFRKQQESAAQQAQQKRAAGRQGLLTNRKYWVG